jgi:hypothetical protein
MMVDARPRDTRISIVALLFDQSSLLPDVSRVVCACCMVWGFYGSTWFKWLSQSTKQHNKLFRPL